MKGRSDKIHSLTSLSAVSASRDTYIDGVRKKDFEADHQLQDALVRKLEVIGEAAKGLSEKLRIHNAQIPWQKLMGMRDRIVHQYFRVDLDIVWTTVKKDIPVLERNITPIYQKIK